MLRALKNGGVQTRVLCLTRGEFFEREIKSLGVVVEYVGGSDSQPVRLWRIIRSLRRDPVDIIQSVHFYTNLYVAVAASVAGARGIGAIRNDLTSEELKRNGVSGRGHLRLPRHIIANSVLARDRAIEHGIAPERIDLLPNAVDVDWLSPTRNGNGRQTVNVLFVGRLAEQKRPDLFLRVVANLNQKLPPGTVKATMIGDGPMRSQLEALAPSLGLGPGCLKLVGQCDDMPSAYRQSDMLVLTSAWEGTPNVVLEAMACGLAVVATRVGGVTEIAGEGRGLLVDSGSEKDLTAATLKLVEDEGLRRELGKRGAEYVTRFHSIDGLRSQLTSIYHRVLAA